MKTLFRLAAAIALLGCLWWALSKPAFDSITATLVALATLVGAMVSDRSTEGKMSQTVSGGSTGIQAGGDVKIDR